MKTLNHIYFWILFGLLNFLFSSFSFSQQPITFSKSYNKNVVLENVWPSSDKGYIAGGYFARWDTIVNDWNYDNYILKTDSMGNILWEKTYDFTIIDGMCVHGSIVRELSNGGYVYISSINCAQNPPNPISKYLLIRMNNNGDTLWTKTYKRPKRSMGQWVEPTSDGGFIMTGYAADYGTSADVYIVKADSFGNEEWNKAYQLYGEEQATCIRQTSDGGYIVAAGSSPSYAEADTWLLKLNSSGDTLWTKIFPWGMWNVHAIVEITQDDGFIVAVKDSNYYQVVFKTDSLGNLLWSNNFGQGNACVTPTNDNGFAVFGLNYFTKTDENGIILQTLSNSINPYFWRQTVDGGYITAIDNNLIKTDCQGNYLFWDSVNCPASSTIIPEVISSSTQQRVIIFPNPSNGQFTIKGNDIQIIEIVDVTGKLVFKKEYYQKKLPLSINLTDQPKGVYFVSLNTSVGKKTRKMILLH